MATSDFFLFEPYWAACVPRVMCPNADHGVKYVPVPWAHAGSGFTLLFEAVVMALAREMPVKAAAAALLGEQDTSIWWVIDHYIQSVRAQADYSEVRRVDMDQHRLLFGNVGSDHETFKAFAKDLKGHNAVSGNITESCLDMSTALIGGGSFAERRN